MYVNKPYCWWQKKNGGNETPIKNFEDKNQKININLWDFKKNMVQNEKFPQKIWANYYTS